MQRCAATFVLLINIQTLLLEVVQADWGIALSCHMKHVYTSIICSMYISTKADQSRYCIQVSIERGKVKGSKFFIVRVLQYVKVLLSVQDCASVRLCRCI